MLDMFYYKQLFSSGFVWYDSKEISQENELQNHP